MKLYNTLTQKKELLPSRGKRELRLFVCGPTVYDETHIGHARTYIFFDLFVRHLIHLGKKIYYLQNITDIEDRIIRRANELNEDPLLFAKKYQKKYLEDMKSLGIISVTRYAAATKHIPEIIKQVQKLLKKKIAYLIEEDGIYFDVTTFPGYGKLSRRTTEQAEDAVSRIDENVGKRNKADFCLWKFSKEGDPSWKAPFGSGRPGWHIEDTAISEKYFGAQYELHGGGLDLKFPHHEAEIAQQESASGKTPFVQIWMHVGLLNVDGQKMSKSLGNFITVKDFLKKYSPAVMRFIVLRQHYRSPMDYTQRLATESLAALENISEFVAKLSLLKKGSLSKEVKTKLADTEKKFNEALQNDFNTPEALAVIFNLISDINHNIWELSNADGIQIKSWLTEKLDIFGITLPKSVIPAKIRRLAKSRELLRSNKQFMQADGLRKEIDALGYMLEDTPRGPLIQKRDLWQS